MLPKHLKKGDKVAIQRALKAVGVFESIHGILHGKPMDEKYYNEYKSILIEIVDNPKLPILFNLNIRHATPRGISPLQARIIVDLEEKRLEFKEEVFLWELKVEFSKWGRK